MEEKIEPSTELATLNTIRVETALSRYPVHRLARKGSIKIEVNESGGRGEPRLKWKVSHNSEYGQPGPLAYKLDTLLINRRIEEARRPIHPMLKLGSLSDICRELSLADSGKNRSDIKKSLIQNAFAGIVTNTQYRLADGSEQTIDAAFHRYSVIFTGEKLPDGRKADGVYILLNDVFIRVINGAMTRPLDYDYLKSLPPAPQRFYELLSYHMYAALKYDRLRAKLTYSEFCAHAPQTRHFDPKAFRNQMNKVHRPHRESGYIADVKFNETTDSDGRPDWIMLYQPGPKARAEYRAFTKRGGPSVLEISPQDTSPLSAAEQLERELVQRGVTGAIAQELVRDHAEEKILQQIEILDWRLQGKKADKIDDPAAWLVSAIKSPAGHAAPKGFVSKAERQKRDEAKQARERKAAEERHLKQAEEAKERDEQRAILAFWNALSPQQQSELDSRLEAAEDPKKLATQVGPLKDFGRLMRRHVYIRQVLQEQGTLMPVKV